MAEKWWNKQVDEHKVLWNLSEESAGVVSCLRDTWKLVLSLSSEINYYETPAGIYRVIEKEDGTLVRLEYVTNSEVAELILSGQNLDNERGN